MFLQTCFFGKVSEHQISFALTKIMVWEKLVFANIDFYMVSEHPISVALTKIMVWIVIIPFWTF